MNVEVDDADGQIDEITSVGPQTFTEAVTIGEVTYAAGTTYNSAYDLTNTATGHKVTSIHFGGNGTQQGSVQGIISTAPLVPGVSYTFNAERSSYLRTDNTYETYEEAPCFTSGTMIDTLDGQKAVEDIVVGDLLRTRDNGFQPVRWVGSRFLGQSNLQTAPRLRPIRISAGALGMGLPGSDLLVSPQHRILIRSRIVARSFDTTEVLVAAKHLTECPGIEIADDVKEVEYVHFLFDQHEIVYANGAETESLYTGAQALKSIGSAAREEIFSLFPALADTKVLPPVGSSACIGTPSPQPCDASPEKRPTFGRAAALARHTSPSTAVIRFPLLSCSTRAEIL
ncbi:MAG: Hint domain-containing protein [Sedimentitalea sp.]|uniref:Hint domain-containing protein n=1 Tax=Sedimentitalea sp. TaxID=2048915 RepID=UPI00326400DF